MRRIAVITSGGDAPGMNAAIRAVVRSALDRDWEVAGVRHGFRGLLAGEFEPLNARSVSGIIQSGGTILGSARCPEMKESHEQRRGLALLDDAGFDGLVVIGGDGSQQGAAALARLGFPVVGVSSTIDNDLSGTDITIGADSALTVAVDAIDRLKTTASSHGRAFLVETMGRHHGYLALMAAVAGGAEAVVLPGAAVNPEAVAEEIRVAYARGKAHAIVVVAEGATMNATALVQWFTTHHERFGFELRATILGHLQRGGPPTVSDRVLATKLGAAAVTALSECRQGVLIGFRNGEVAATPYEDVIGRTKALDPEMLRLARVLTL